jgi:glycosyltransferase involved in cell wall biosynthesis
MAKIPTIRTIVEHVDLERLVPGGIDTCIKDILSNVPEGTVRVIGISEIGTLPKGKWSSVQVGNNSIEFLPVAEFSRSRRKGLRIPDSLKFVMGLVRYSKHIRGALVQTHRVETGFVSRLLGCSRNIQFIHNDGVALTGQHSDSIWKRLPKLYRILERQTLTKSSGVVLFNEKDADRIRSIRRDAYVSSTWYDENTFSYDASEQRDLYTWVGRLEEQKDPVLAARVFIELCRTHAEAQCVMVGDGSLLENVRREIAGSGLAGDRINLAGRLGRPDVANLMRRSKATLLTSHYEGSPRVLFESLACGAPMAATLESDPGRILRPGINGAHCSRDASQIAESLRELSELDPEDVHQSVRVFSAQTVIPKVLAVGV